MAQDLENNIELAERVEAFVARFGRLQDTLGDKLLPTLLKKRQAQLSIILIAPSAWDLFHPWMIG